MASTVETAAAPLIDRVPLAVCGAGLGMVGLGNAWLKAAERFGAPAWIALGLALLGLATAALLTGVLAVKALRRADDLAAELASPLRGPLAATGPMLVSASASAALPFSTGAATVLVIVAALLHLALAVYMVRRWIALPVILEDVHPGWFLPIAGALTLVPPAVAVGQEALAWCAMGGGGLLWLPLFALVLYRLVFSPPLPAALSPVLFVLFAPPALMFNAYVALTSALDPFAHIIMHGATVLALIVATLLPTCLRSVFSLAWWAMTFPLAALTIAMLTYADLYGGTIGAVTALALLAATTVLVAVVLARSLAALRAGTLFPA